jgi:signal transduction histidine kinase
MKSIYLKNFTATAVLISLGLLLVAVSALGLGRGYVINEYMDNMLNCAFEVAHTASAVAEEESLNSWRLGMILSSVSKAAGNHIFITDENDRVVCCCDDFPFCIHYYKVIPETLSRVSSSSDVYQGRQMLEGFFEGERLIVAVPVTSAENSSDFIGTVIVSTQPNSIFSPWKPFLLILLAIWAVVLATVLIFAFGFSKRMAKPLDEIAEASRSFARGDFSVRVQQRSDSSDEVGALIESFNKMADSLENAEKRRSEFISNVSHELRTPMTTISGFADGILDGTIPKEQEDVYLRSIRDETRRLARLVRTMLDASRTRAAAADPARRTDFDLTELIVQTLLSFESRATEKNLDVDPQLPENSVMVHADKDGITQVIYNLLDNAVKFADRGSCITLRLYKDEKKAYIAVRDIGETIPPDDLPYIFDRFHKSDRSRSLDKDGVGLGLSLVKSIINGHDEDIVVRSENGVTEFVFSLALTES